jgi:hypothetical protein
MSSSPSDTAQLRSPASPTPALVEETRRTIRAPWAAGLAGILFAILFTSGLVLIRSGPWTAASDAELAEIFRTQRDFPTLIGGLYLAPFAGIMFLWFIAVVRDQVGSREDQFFATVFIGSGLLFVATLFAASALAVAPMVGYRYLGQPAPTEADIELVRSIAYTLLFAFATRAGSVFLFTTATIGLRSGAFPRWVALTGYALGLAMLIAVSFWDWVVLVLPGWVAVLSIFILQRERARRRHEHDGTV